MTEANEQTIPLLSRLRAPEGAVKGKKRKGRGPGSGLGKTCGKGQKGQKARAGGTVRRGFEGGQTPLHRRLPKVGFKNPFSKTIATVNLQSLSRFDSGAVVDPESLAAVGLVSGRHDGIKILGQGELDRALTVRAHAFSARAKEVIEKAGGKTEVIGQQAAAEAAAEA